MSSRERTPVLFNESEVLDDNTDRKRTVINHALSFVDEAGIRVVFYWQEPIFRFALSDMLTLRYVAVHLRLNSSATQEELSRAFGHSVATQRRWENRYQAEGLEGLLNGQSSGRPSGIPKTLDGVLRKWFAEGVSNRAMARRLNVSDAAIHRALARLGLHRRERESAELPWPDDVEQDASQDDREESGSEGAQETRDAAEFSDSIAETKNSKGKGGSDKETVASAAVDEESRGRTVSSGEDRSAGSVEQTEQPYEPDQAVVAKRHEVEEESLPSEQGSGVSTEPDGGMELLRGFGEKLEDVLAEYAEKGFTIDRDPDERNGDRGLARIGELEDALPLFGDRPELRQAGVLLTIPFLVESGLLEVFNDVYHSLGPAFYGLRTTVVVLFLSALLRIKRPENLKEYNPRELGHVVGLDRFPEVKTVRRKLEQLGARRRATELMHAMAQRRIDADPDRVAFLYLDGHVREYHGHYPLAKTKKSQHQVARAAATDNWVHDAQGEPLLVVTSEMNESLTQVMEPILSDVKALIGDRRPIVIFDRGGYSPKLFVRLVKLGFDVMTYRKGKFTSWPVSHFHEEEYVVDGWRYYYRVAERPRVRVGRLRAKRKKESSGLGPQFLWMREVRVLRADGRQTSILTTRRDLADVEVPYRQFNRWRQENYFKYMDAEFELDALVEYGVEDVSEDVDRPNPSRRPLERELTAARARVQRLQAQLGAAVGGEETSRQRTVRGFKIAHAKLRAELAEGEAEVARLQAELESMPRRISGEGLKTLKREKKLIADTIKMTAYQVETRLLGMLRDNYRRTEDEGRTLLHAAFQSTARIKVRGEELYVELAPQSSPHRTKAIANLCADLNKLDSKFPGTCLRLHFTIQPHEPLTKP